MLGLIKSPPQIWGICCCNQDNDNQHYKRVEKLFSHTCVRTHTNERRKETNIKMQEKKSSATESVTRLLLSLDLNTHLTVNCNDYSLPGCCSNLKCGMYLRPQKKCWTVRSKSWKWKFYFSASSHHIVLCCKCEHHTYDIYIYIWCFGIYSKGMWFSFDQKHNK